ncbi:iron uptake system protein EfeO [Streptomyces sp. NPDC048337]|uniref:iron uptake system protein EfeO n=1 Tax=Streptomyces sp. NPDC048337 TaxID=3365535 RepID=UPI003723257F
MLFPDDRVVAERENIGPGTKATITAEIKAGDYEFACKSGMKGDGIRTKVKATGSGGEKRSPELDAAVASYRSYVLAQAEESLPAVRTFTDAVRAGDVEAAKRAFASSRRGWERTEPVAESFGDIDPKTEVREDGLEPGQHWTGWHRLEKSLWADGRIGDEEKALASQLDTDIAQWHKRVGTAEITPTSMANGAKELLDEVSRNKVTGEEDRYSHTDLADFKANVNSTRRELFYWATVLTTFALGTAVGDLTAGTLHLGYLPSGFLFAALIALPVLFRRFLGLNAVAAFWAAYILTRPLGASFADWMGVPVSRDGLGWGTGAVSLALLVPIAVLVGYLQVSRADTPVQQVPVAQARLTRSGPARRQVSLVRRAGAG